MNDTVYAQRLSNIQQRLATSADNANRPKADVQLLAVSKTKPASMVMAYYDLGLRAFGENYLQDGLVKIDALAHLADIEWHFIGPIQSNKTKPIAEHFDWVETVCREKIATRLNEQRPLHLAPLNVLIQVNISGEAQKSGISLDEIEPLANYIDGLERLTLRGLMCIPEHADEQTIHAQFATMNQQFEMLKSRYESVDTLSMGMSQDLDIAILHGSTEVRIGTDLFGPREPLA